MKNKRIFCLLLSFAVLFCITVPGTLATAAEAEADDEAVMETTETEGQMEENEMTDEDKMPDEITDEDTIPTDKIPAADEEPIAEDAAVFEHFEGCADDCKVEGCTCSCHEKSLFEKLMAAETLEAFDMIAAAATEEELTALTEEENTQINAKIEAMEPQPLPAVVIDETENKQVPSEIVQGTVNFSNVAPLGDPVVGGEE